MYNTYVFNQVTPKRGYLCLCLLLLAMVFSTVASIQMTLSMLPNDSTESVVSMAHMDDKPHQHCDSGNADSCHNGQANHDHKSCSQVHCSTLPVLASPFQVAMLFAQSSPQRDPVLMLLAGQPETPYIPPIA